MAGLRFKLPICRQTYFAVIRPTMRGVNRDNDICQEGYRHSLTSRLRLHEKKLAGMLESRNESKVDYFMEHDSLLSELESANAQLIEYKEDCSLSSNKSCRVLIQNDMVRNPQRRTARKPGPGDWHHKNKSQKHEQVYVRKTKPYRWGNERGSN